MRRYPSYIRAALERRKADVNVVDEPENIQDPNKTPVPGTDAQFNPMEDKLLIPPATPEIPVEMHDHSLYDLHREGAVEPPSQFFWNGLSVVLENPKGSIREGTDKDGEHWEIEMKDHYGFIKDTAGEDDEGVDVFVNPDAPEHFDNQSGTIWVVHQEVDGKYDEDKVMIGYNSQDEAEKAYLRNYEKGWKLGEVSEYTDVDFLNHYIKECWKPKKHKKKAQVSIQEINQPDNVVGMDGIGEPGAPGQRTQSHQDENREESTVHLTGVEGTADDASVKAPYSSGMNYDSTMFDIDQTEHNLIQNASLERVGSIGSDPYKLGRIYKFEELLPQHRKEIRVNKRDFGPDYKRHLWLRTTMKTAHLIKESKPWYDKNRNKKWELKDKERVYDLADLFMKGAVCTPLLVSPPGEPNGGLWEGYHRLRAHDMLDLEHVPVIMKIDPRDPTSLNKTAQFKKEPWVCVDLDNTIANEDPSGEYKLDNVEPMEGAKAALEQMMGRGWRVTIFTARAHFADKDPEWKSKVEAWLDKNGIPYTEVWSGPKPPADAFIDDAAIAFDGNWGAALVNAEENVKINRTAVGSGVLDTGDNEPDAYTNGDETRSGAAFPLDEAMGDLNQKTAGSHSSRKK